MVLETRIQIWRTCLHIKQTCRYPITTGGQPILHQFYEVGHCYLCDSFRELAALSSAIGSFSWNPELFIIMLQIGGRSLSQSLQKPLSHLRFRKGPVYVRGCLTKQCLDKLICLHFLTAVLALISLQLQDILNAIPLQPIIDMLAGFRSSPLLFVSLQLRVRTRQCEFGLCDFKHCAGTVWHCGLTGTVT